MWNLAVSRHKIQQEILAAPTRCRSRDFESKIAVEAVDFTRVSERFAFAKQLLFRLQ
jgi:hypothetical protein